MSLTAGTRLGAYEIVALIGAGGMGEVYRAKDTRLKREVAIKVLPDAFASDPDRLARFQREAELLATLNHPNIGAVYGLEQSTDASAIVLELIEGDTLADRIAKGPIPVNDALPVARQIAEALEAAHERGIIHRDLKPANIKLRDDGTVKVLDFGLAKALNPGIDTDRSSKAGPHMLSQSPTITSPAMTLGGVILGTAAYMSPEQARGKTADKRADVWAFGCVLYEMLTGARPFDGEEVSDTLAAILRAEPDWKKLPADTPKSIQRLMRRCLEKDRKNRLHDVGDARLEIQDSLRADANEESPAAPAVRSSRRTIIFASGVALLLGSLIAGTVVWMTTRATRAPAPTPRRFGLTPPSALPVLISPGRNIAISPDGNTVAYIGSDGLLYIRRLDRLEPTVLADLGPVLQPFFSPDGRSLGFLSGRELKKVALSGGPAATIAAVPSTLRGATWMSDGRIVFATIDLTFGLSIVNSAGGKPVTLITPDPKQNDRYFWPEAIPGSHALLFTVYRGESTQVAVLNLDTLEYKALVAGSNARYSPTGHLIYASGSTVFAAPFDLDRLELSGESTPVLERVQATPNGGTYFELSNDGTLIYVPGDGGQAEYTFAWVDRYGKEDPIAIPPKAYFVPRISPDNTRITAHVEDSANVDVFVYDLGRKSEMRLTFDAARDSRPLWSPDSRWIYFRSEMNGPGVYRKASDGTGAVDLVVPVLGDGSANSISPDGKWLLYSSMGQSTARDIWMMSTDGTSKPQGLITEPGSQGNPVVSPDGRWVAYQDEARGYIYVRPFPDVNGGRWQVSAEDSKWPVWSRDGRELFFVSRAVPARGIMSIAVQAEGKTFAYSAPAIVLNKMYVGFPGNIGPRNYDLSPDGKRFLVIQERAADSTSRTIVMVENWFEELKRLVPVQHR